MSLHVVALGKDGSSALLLAAFNGHTDIVDLLLMDAGVNILQRLPNGMTALHIAIQQGHLGVVEVGTRAVSEMVFVSIPRHAYFVLIRGVPNLCR